MVPDEASMSGLGEIKHVSGQPPVLPQPGPLGDPSESTGVTLDLPGFGPADDESEATLLSQQQAYATYDDEQATFEVVQRIVAGYSGHSPQEQCAVPQDGFHVKSVDYVRPFKLVGEVVGNAKIRISGEASYRADIERDGTWKITQPYERTGHDDIFTPVTELGHLETKQQVKVDKVVYGEKQIIDGQVIPGQPGATTWDWDTQDFKPTGPMVGKCGTATCGMKDKGPKEYTEEKTCDNLVIENVELKVNSLQEVEHKDFKQYKLHVDDSIPRLCQNTLPKGLLKAMAAKNIGIESLFKADVNFNVVKTEDITACEVQTIAKQDFELKYDEKHTLKWKQPISKECTKEWTQDGIEYGKGTYEQTDQADITGYYIQPGAELGQINTYIRQHNDDRQEGEETKEEHTDGEGAVGERRYEVVWRGPWERASPDNFEPRKVTIHEEVVEQEEEQYKPAGVVELEPLLRVRFQKCPLLKVAPNEPCPLDPADRAAFVGELHSPDIRCADKVPEVFAVGKCALQHGRYLPAPQDEARPGAVRYAEAEEGPPEDSPAGLLAALAGTLEKELRDVFERGARADELAAAHARRAGIEGTVARHDEEVRAATEALAARAGELGVPLPEELPAMFARVKAEVEAARAAAQLHEAEDRAAIVAAAAHAADRVSDLCPGDPDGPAPSPPPLEPPPPPYEPLPPPYEPSPPPYEPSPPPYEPPPLPYEPPPPPGEDDEEVVEYVPREIDLPFNPPDEEPPPTFDPQLPPSVGEGPRPQQTCAPPVQAARPTVKAEEVVYRGETLLLPPGSTAFLQQGGVLEYDGRLLAIGPQPGTVVDAPPYQPPAPPTNPPHAAPASQGVSPGSSAAEESSGEESGGGEENTASLPEITPYSFLAQSGEGEGGSETPGSGNATLPEGGFQLYNDGSASTGEGSGNSSTLPQTPYDESYAEAELAAAGAGLGLLLLDEATQALEPAEEEAPACAEDEDEALFHEAGPGAALAAAAADLPAWAADVDLIAVV
eukprot:tig00001098_g7071.t1